MMDVFTYCIDLVHYSDSFTIGFPMGTTCASLLAVLCVHAYEVDFVQGLLKISPTFNSSFCYIDLSLSNSRFGHLYLIYLIEINK